MHHRTQNELHKPTLHIALRNTHSHASLPICQANQTAHDKHYLQNEIDFVRQYVDHRDE